MPTFLVAVSLLAPGGAARDRHHPNCFSSLYLTCRNQLVASLVCLGGNITGLSQLDDGLLAKCLARLKKTAFSEFVGRAQA
jgi:hypothetical protein